jgi:XFP N-terminal domain
LKTPLTNFPRGGELGYALAVAFGAVMDYPDLIVTCVIGDGEAETGPTATYVTGAVCLVVLDVRFVALGTGTSFWILRNLVQ